MSEIEQTLPSGAEEPRRGPGHHQSRHAHSGSSRFRLFIRRPTTLALVAIVLLYLALALTYSILTPAGEANDEIDHVQYIEHIARTGTIPRISLTNGHESHQPPLYYLVAAAWQDLLQIHPFNFAPPLSSSTRAGPNLKLSHRYTAQEHEAAVAIHELRLLSILFGLATVVLTFVAGMLATKKASISLMAAAAVALVPKQLLVSSMVTNDSLVIALGSLSLVLLLKWIRLEPERQGRGHWLSAVLGISLGAAALAKFSSLPLTGITVLIVVGVSAVRARRAGLLHLLDPVILTASFLVISGWWFIRNNDLYGQYLAQNVSNSYLKPFLPSLVSPVPWLNSQRFLHFVPSQLFGSAWYDGDWNQLSCPIG